MPFYSRIFSIRTFVFLIIVAAILVYTSLVLWSGSRIMHTLIEQYSEEIITEKLNSVIHQLDMRYENLQRKG